MVYDFDLNNWWPEEHKREFRFQFNHNMNGYTKPYFTDETGRLFRDETGNLDNGESIPMEIEFGRSNFGTDQGKNYASAMIDTEDARGMVLQYSLDGGDFQTLGQITKKIELLVWPQGEQLVEGRDINYKIVHNDKGSPPIFNGITTHFSVNERRPDESSKQR